MLNNFVRNIYTNRVWQQESLKEEVILSDLFTSLKNNLQGKKVKIVFPEGLDERIISAAGRLASEDILTPILVGKTEEIQAKANELSVSLASVEIFDPEKVEFFEELVTAFVECRKGKVTEEDARKILLDENYFGTMLVHAKKADGLVSGAAHSTADTVRPALQIIKTKEGIRKTSGVFIMVREDIVVISQNGVYAILGFQLREYWDEGIQFGSMVVHQVAGKYNQVRMLLEDDVHGFLDGPCVVSPTSGVNVGQLDDSIAIESFGKVFGYYLYFLDLEVLFSFGGSEDEVTHGI